MLESDGIFLSYTDKGGLLWVVILFLVSTIVASVALAIHQKHKSYSRFIGWAYFFFVVFGIGVTWPVWSEFLGFLPRFFSRLILGFTWLCLGRPVWHENSILLKLRYFF